MNRRAFLKAGAGALAAVALPAQARGKESLPASRGQVWRLFDTRDATFGAQVEWWDNARLVFPKLLANQEDYLQKNRTAVPKPYQWIRTVRDVTKTAPPLGDERHEIEYAWSEGLSIVDRVLHIRHGNLIYTFRSGALVADADLAAVVDGTATALFKRLPPPVGAYTETDLLARLPFLDEVVHGEEQVDESISFPTK